MMDTSKLPSDTRQLWERLRQEPLLKGFVLVGGTALALRINHRVSEDLDFAYLGDTLPRQRLTQLQQRLAEDNIHLVLDQDVAAEDDFIDAGLDLADFQQNYLAQLPNGKVKLSFARFDGNLTRLLSGNEASALRVATLDEIFCTKATACADRSKARDWFDLYILITQHGYCAADMHHAFCKAGRENSFDVASLRLRSGSPSLADEGFSALIENAPTLNEMRNFFTKELDQLEVELSAAAFRDANQSFGASHRKKRK